MQSEDLSKSQLWLLAVAAGVCVANIYYSQPILPAIAADVGLRPEQAGNLPVLSQVGYGLGLLLLTPLGDKVARKRLIIILQGLLLLVLVGLTLARTAWLLYGLSFLLGFFAVATQVIMPLAAALATTNKGKVVGTVFSGALIGILGARIVSGYLAQWFSWHYVYGLSAGLLLGTTLLIARLVPAVPPSYSGSYGALLASTVAQLGRFPLLRRIALLGALVFGAFCSFWTTLTFHLSGAPFHFQSDVIGLFGVLGVGGALAAPLVGRLAGTGNPARTQVLTMGLVLVSVLLMQWLPGSLPAFIVATLLLDVGVQATQVTNIAQVYSLDETAHSRLNTIYMTVVFVGGAAGTFAGVQAWKWGGWSLVCWQLLLWLLAALLLALPGLTRPARSPAARPVPAGPG